MMPSRGLAPALGSFRVVTPSHRAASHILRNQSSRLLSTAALKQQSRVALRPQHLLLSSAFIQKRNISWSPNTWFGGSPQPAQTPTQTADTTSFSHEPAVTATSTPPTANAASAPASASAPPSNASPVTESATTSVAPQTSTTPIEPTVSATDISDINLDSVYNVGGVYLAEIPERIGYLKELGIDYGWGPTSMLQWTLEHVHVYSGLPWWGSIMTSAMLLRLCLFPLFLRSADISAKMQALKPLTEPAMKRMTAATQSGDQMAMQKAKEEMQTLYLRADISLKKMFIPIVIQGVLAYCALKLMRAMAALPVPGFEHGGALWFTDLTMVDPYLILPLTMAASMHLIFRFGGESGNQMMNSSPGMKTILLYILPVGIFVSMSWFPAAVNLWLSSTSTFAIVQAKLLQKNSVREALGITPIVKIEPTQPATPGTIDVRATSRATDSSSGVQYQAPNINTRQDNMSGFSAAPAQPSVGISERFKGWLVGQANALGQTYEDFMNKARARRAQWYGESKESKTRSKEFINQANAYEKRMQMRKRQNRD